jgi:hypothetical protein
MNDILTENSKNLDFSEITNFRKTTAEAIANGTLVAFSPVIAQQMDMLEKLAKPFIDDISAGRLELSAVLEWLKTGQSKRVSEWQAHEIADYIEQAVRGT